MNKALDPERIKRPWEEQYRDDDVETMPWFCPDLDHDVAVAIDHLGLVAATVLDIGAGPGTQTIALGKLGFKATGTDISPSAVQKARARAANEQADVNFVCDDVLQTQLTGSFALIVDRGCFHVLEPERWPDYVSSVAQMLDAGGYLLLKTFHKQETSEQGPPNRFDADEIKNIFSPSFDLIDSKDSEFKSSLDFNPKALFCVLRKTVC